MKNGLFYGFSSANHSDRSAWFHTREAAERFAEACGWGKVQIEVTTLVNKSDIMDTAKTPWMPTVKGGAR